MDWMHTSTEAVPNLCSHLTGPKISSSLSTIDNFIPSVFLRPTLVTKTHSGDEIEK